MSKPIAADDADKFLKIELNMLEFLIRIGVVDRFMFLPHNDSGFDGKHEYQEDGTANDYEGSGWGVSYSIESLKSYIESSTRIHSNEIEIDTATYGHCSCRGASTTANWDGEEYLDPSCFHKYLSDIDQVLKTIKDDDEIFQSEFFRECLIDNLKSSQSGIYISDEYASLLDHIDYGAIDTKLSTVEIRDSLSYVPFSVYGIIPNLPVLKDNLEKYRKVNTEK